MTRSVAHDAPEPARAAIAAMLAVACDLAKLPAWFGRYQLQMASPAARQALWAVGRRLTQNPDLGFTFAERVPEEAIGSLWPLYSAAPSLRALNAAYNDWSSLLLDFMDLRVVDDGELTWFRLVARDGTRLDRAEQDFRLAMMVKTYRRLRADPSFDPCAIHFNYARPSTTRTHAAALGRAQFEFGGPHLQLAVSRVDADATLPGSRPVLFAQLADEARELVTRAGEATLTRNVENLIAECLARDVNEAAIARKLGVSARSLRRRLAEYGVTFQALLDDVRRREGELLLENVELPIARVARLLGFASDRSFRNSLRRWSMSPGAWRRALVQRAPCERLTRHELSGT